MTILAGRQKGTRTQAESIMSGRRVMKTAQSLLGAARSILAAHTRVPLTPIPPGNPFNLAVINDLKSLIILGIAWRARCARRLR